MQNTYFLGGYYLVEGSSLQTWMNNSLLPPKLHSASNCISQHHPYHSLFSWVNENEQQSASQYSLRLGLDRRQHKILQAKADKWFDCEQYSWGGVWSDRQTARAFAQDYLGQIKDLRLIAIATTEKYRQKLLQDCDPKMGVDRFLHSGQTIEIERGFLGYEILGYEFGFFCSFICNHLETDLEQIGIELNRHGLIEEYEQAIEATNYINLPETGAETLLWVPWAITEIKL